MLIASIRENDQNIRAVVKNYVEEELHSLTKPSFRKPFLLVSMPCGKVVSLSANINVSALDNKMTQMLTGRTGAFCTACKSTSDDMKDIAKVQADFYLDLGTSNWNSIFVSLATDAELDIENPDTVLPSKKGDYNKRFGLKRKPMTNTIEITKSVSVLHASKLRAVLFLEEIMLRDLSGCHQWGKGKLPLDCKARLGSIREKWKNLLGPLLGFCGKSAPNQLTGHLCDVFLSEKKQKGLLEALKEL